MRQDALTSILLIKAVEETDGAGALIPRADRAAATREAIRDDGPRLAGDRGPAGAPLNENARQLLGRRADILRRQLVARYPFVDTVLGVVRGPAWAGWLLMGFALILGGALSALDGSRRIDILAFPLLGLVLWNLVVYALIAVDAARSFTHRKPRRASVPTLLAHLAAQRVRRLVVRSAAFNAPLAGALDRFVAEWSSATRPLLAARAVRLFHLCAACVGIGLIAGLYLRGVALDYRAGWESTFLDPRQIQVVVSALYGPASALTGVAIPDAAHLAALRWEGGGGGESAARWIHLLAATALLFIVLPRVLLAFAATIALWHRSRKARLPLELGPYFRSTFAPVHGMSGRGIAAVTPYAYEPGASALAALQRLLPDALGEGLAVEVHAQVAYGGEDDWLGSLSNSGGASADVLVLLFNLAATPEDENHGSMIAGVRDWLERSHGHAQLLVLVDEGPYLARMQRGPGGDRIAERRELWRRFVEERGLDACFVDLGQRGTAIDESAGRIRATLWQASADA